MYTTPIHLLSLAVAVGFVQGYRYGKIVHVCVVMLHDDYHLTLPSSRQPSLPTPPHMGQPSLTHMGQVSLYIPHSYEVAIPPSSPLTWASCPSTHPSRLHGAANSLHPRMQTFLPTTPLSHKRQLSHPTTPLIPLYNSHTGGIHHSPPPLSHVAAVPSPSHCHTKF